MNDNKPQAIPLASLLDLQSLATEKGALPPIAAFKSALKKADESLAEKFREGAAAASLVKARADVVDGLLKQAWTLFFDTGPKCPALVAVGGYGRGELHPASDIDLLILLDKSNAKYNEQIAQFITFLWDIGLEPGHSVRDLKDCVREAKADITVVTNLMEARLLVGDTQRFEKMREKTGPDHIWPMAKFFEAKLEEQEQRHLKFGDTGYRLEPNVKEGPGGLRDLQIIGWVLKRQTGAESLTGLVEHGYLTTEECDTLLRSQELLWRARFALHILSGRREDRLLFDQQIAVSHAFGYEDGGNNLAVEQFMQSYYRTIMRLSRLNEMLLQLFRERVLHTKNKTKPLVINKRFQLRHGYLEAVDDKTFQRYPFALMELFLIMAQNQDIKGVRAETIRMVRRDRLLIDKDFRADLRNRSLFMEIMRQPQGITHEMRRMNRYGVLARYIPAFGAVVGRMQYDLFHAYTVDEHTMFVLRNARRLFIDKHDNELPFASRIGKRIPKPELLFLACLFHDIAKGRGGDHSQLGAVDARDFCHQHGLSRFDTRLVAWLVQSHLLMSGTTQRKDITDPDVIQEFAAKVGDETHLQYLYLLTLSDIRGTNPKLWNTWKDALLRDLYLSTQRALRRGLARPLDPGQRVRETRQEARVNLHSLGISDQRIEKLWRHFDEEYFLRHTADEIAWQGSEIADHMKKSTDPEQPLVRVRQDASHGSTAVFVHIGGDHHHFARVTSLLDKLNLSIVDARIIGNDTGYSYDTYHVLESDGTPIEAHDRRKKLQEHIAEDLCHRKTRPVEITRRTPRENKAFETPTTVTFFKDTQNNKTMVEVIAADRPGLLSRIGEAFGQCRVRLRNAKVSTIGERAEDVFLITDDKGKPIKDQDRQNQIRETLEEIL